MDQVLSDEMVKGYLPLYLDDSGTTINQLDIFLTLVSASEKSTPLISEDAKDGAKCVIACFQIDILSDMSAENLLLEHLNDIAGGLIIGICGELRKAGSLRIVKRSGFRDDAEYIDYLKNNDAGIVLGNQWVFHTNRYNSQMTVEQHLEERKTIFAGFADFGILLKGNCLKIYVEDVRISIRPPLTKDSGARYDPERGIYL